MYMRKFLVLLRASPVVGAQYGTLQKHYSHPSFVIYFFFSNPPIKLKLWLQIRGRILIAKQSDQSLLWLAHQKHGAAVRSHLLHSSLAAVRLCCAFLAASANYAKMLGQNHFVKPNQHVLTSFLYPILIAGSPTEHCWRCSKKGVYFIPWPNWWWLISPVVVVMHTYPGH